MLDPYGAVRNIVHQMTWRDHLREGAVIPAHPLALTANRKLDEQRQRALTRYYVAAGAGGIAAAVHTTQFEIRDHGLLAPVLQLAAEEATNQLRIGGVVGKTAQAVKEAELAAGLGYHAGLLSLSALASATVPELLDHARAVASVIPLFGFYLQPAVGGRVLPYRFWRAFAEIENVVAIKVAPFNRYQTIDVVRAVAESGRAHEIALYTGNDDNILLDLLTPFHFGNTTVRIVGGLLGHWSVWTRRAVELLDCVKQQRGLKDSLTLASEITDSNAAFFDAANNFHGCIAGIHEVLRRQGLLAGRWCLDPREDLSPGQIEEIDRVYRAYPYLNDDAFVQENLDRWMR
jgi:dihydrodipicolinate synthase/N-acetylneuraminate lyase